MAKLLVSPRHFPKKSVNDQVFRLNDKAAVQPVKTVVDRFICHYFHKRCRFVFMDASQTGNFSKSKEMQWYLFFNIIVFVIYCMGQGMDGLTIGTPILFLNYALAGWMISYYLIPRFLQKNQFWAFGIGVFLMITVVMLLEEFVIEQFFFPDTRGKFFRGFIKSIFDASSVSFLLVGFKLIWENLRQKEAVEEMKLAVTQSELQFLKSQINPHFLFNNLNNLYAFALENSPKTPDIILQLSSLLRYMLYDCQEDNVRLDKELKHLENFIKLQELQIEDRGVVDFSVSGFFGEKRIAPLILMAFVENSFKHSASSQTDKIEINIDITVENDKLVMYCDNTFSGTNNLQNLNSGIGLENVKQRLELLYPNRYDLDITTTDGWYKVKLAMTL